MDNIRSMMYNSERKPWHQKGIPVNGLATAAEALHKAGLDFEVRKVPCYAKQSGSETYMPVPQTYATIRTDTSEVLGTVKSRYKVMQNHEAFSFFDALVDRDEAIYETAGCLGKGEKVWLLAKLPDYIQLPGDDKVENFVLIANSHDGSMAVTAMITPIRVVCQNTLNVAVGSTANKITIRHAGDIEGQLRDAHRILGISNKLNQELDFIFNMMAERKVSIPELQTYTNRVLDPDWQPGDELSPIHTNIGNAIKHLAYAGIGQDMPSADRTMWGAFNAVAEYVDYTSKDAKWVLYGHGATLKQRAFDLAVELLNN